MTKIIKQLKSEYDDRELQALWIATINGAIRKVSSRIIKTGMDLEPDDLMQLGLLIGNRFGTFMLKNSNDSQQVMISRKGWRVYERKWVEVPKK